MKPSQTIKINDDIWCPVSDLTAAVEQLEEKVFYLSERLKEERIKLNELEPLYSLYLTLPESFKTFIEEAASLTEE